MSYLNYPSNAANGQPSKEEIAVAKMASSYFLEYQAAIAAVLKYLEKENGKTAMNIYILQLLCKKLYCRYSHRKGRRQKCSTGNKHP